MDGPQVLDLLTLFVLSVLSPLSVSLLKTRGHLPVLLLLHPCGLFDFSVRTPESHNGGGRGVGVL